MVEDIRRYKDDWVNRPEMFAFSHGINVWCDMDGYSIYDVLYDTLVEIAENGETEPISQEVYDELRSLANTIGEKLID